MTSSKKNCETIPFSVVHVTSEDEQHPGKLLASSRPDNSGWQSAANCSFPQHVIIKLNYSSTSPSSLISLSQIKVLTHETKIAKRIEIFLASQSNDTPKGDSPLVWNDSSIIRFQRLGFVSFDSNERSNYRARELKSIKLGGVSNVSFIKLVLHECHSNQLNQANQVGIVSIIVISELGANVTDVKEDKSPDPNRIDNFQVSPHNSATDSLLKTNQKEIQTYRNPSDSRKKGLGHAKRLDAVLKANQYVEDEVKKRLESLEKLKLMRATIEDYDGAARIKEVLIRMRGQFDSFQMLHKDMQQAAKEEDYELASRFKEQRDEAREIVLEALDEGNDIRSDYSCSTQGHSIEDLSLSTVSAALPLPSRIIQSRSPGTKDDEISLNNRMDIISYNESVSAEGTGDDVGDSSISIDGKGFKDHPLHGVTGFEDLPIPEEVSFEGADASPETVQRLETLTGTYVAKCFFSRQWSLREAAIQKTILVLPSIREHISKDLMYKGLLLIAERGLEDRIVQVVLTALIFLDSLIAEFEKGGITQKDAIPLLTPIILNLIGKLGDSKPKVVDTAEKALMSFALSTCIGPSCIAHHLIKRSPVKDLKGGKAMVIRFIILRQLMEDFDLPEGPSSERVLEWIRDCGINHKEAEVRDAAKDLTVAIYLRDGTTLDVLSILEGLSERQVKEYKIAFATAKKTRGGRSAYTQDHQIQQRVTFDEINGSQVISDFDHPSLQQKSLDEMVMVRGRGRGRGRVSSSLQHQFSTEASGDRSGKSLNMSWPESKNLRNLSFDEDDESDYRRV